MKIFFDGGCRPNPGTMEIAVVAGGEVHIVDDLGQGTSEEAEWLALVHALRIAHALGTRSSGRSDFVLLGDAAGVVRQANGSGQPRGIALRHLKAMRALTGEAGMPRIRHIKRTQNLAGIALAARHAR